MPGKSFRQGITLIEAVKQFGDEEAAEEMFIEARWPNGVACPGCGSLKLSSLYEAFEPAEARRIAERLEIHYTPKHGSWLNMAEIEIGVLALQCLDRRIANQDILRGEVNAWQNQRNRDVIRVDWRFTTEDARIKLKSLYPSIQKKLNH